ncbi:hypothetical protein JCM12141A_50550 [Mycolicibacterium hodleri]
MAPVSTTGTLPPWVSSSQSAVSSIVSVPWVITTPSAPPWAAAATAALIRSQSEGTSWELSTAIRSTTSTSTSSRSPAVRSSPVWVGRATPSAPVLVAMVPPVVITTTRLIR